MKTDQPTGPFRINGPEIIVELHRQPAMGIIFLKALGLSLFRSRAIPLKTGIRKPRFILKNYQPNREQINAYKTVCAFSRDPSETIPIPFFQVPFTGLLGKCITSPFFPLNPLGLIHVFQSFDLKRPVAVTETLDLACTLSGMRKTEKGMETDFILDVLSKDALVWQGRSTFLIRNREKDPAGKSQPSHRSGRFPLKTEVRIPVPSDTGRQYAKVSGDYNPYHLFLLPAKLFGFKRAIAHGMWSLANVTSRLEQALKIRGPFRVEAYFKRPIFMPAQTILGYECETREDKHPVKVNFELRDQRKGFPHIKGRFLYPDPKEE